MLWCQNVRLGPLARCPDVFGVYRHPSGSHFGNQTVTPLGKTDGTKEWITGLLWLTTFKTKTNLPPTCDHKRSFELDFRHDRVMLYSAHVKPWNLPLAQSQITGETQAFRARWAEIQRSSCNWRIVWCPKSVTYIAKLCGEVWLSMDESWSMYHWYIWKSARTVGAKGRVFPEALTLRPHRRCKRACLSGGTNTVSFSWGGGGPFFCR